MTRTRGSQARFQLKRLVITLGIVAAAAVLAYSVFAWMVWTTGHGGFLVFMAPLVIVWVFGVWKLVGMAMESREKYYERRERGK